MENSAPSDAQPAIVANTATVEAAAAEAAGQPTRVIHESELPAVMQKIQTARNAEAARRHNLGRAAKAAGAVALGSMAEGAHQIANGSLVAGAVEVGLGAVGAAMSWAAQRRNSQPQPPAHITFIKPPHS